MKAGLVIPVLSAVLLVIVLTVAYKIQPVTSPKTDKDTAHPVRRDAKEPDSPSNNSIYSRRPVERLKAAAGDVRGQEKVTKNDIPQLITNISKTDGKNMLAPSELDKLIQTTSLGEALAVTNDLSESAIRSLISVVPADYLKQKLLNSGLGITEEDLKQSSPEEMVYNTLKIAKGEFG
ncbi:MAG: hypothetical protein HY762_04920, partial [Planctomycetes bacterium]|nr:hypothetical protein [Planctomycetota bacterium]